MSTGLHSGWQRERAGLFFGLDGLQTTTLAAAALGLLVVIVARSWMTAGILVPLALVLAGAALVRIEGRAPVQWARTFCSYQLVRLYGAHRFRPKARWQLSDADGAVVAPEDPADEWQLPGVLAPLRLLSAEYGQSLRVAVVHHRSEATYAAVAKVRHPGLVLLASDRAHNRVEGWAGWLAQQCSEDGAVCRIATYHVAEPGEVDELDAWVQEHIHPDAPPQATALMNDVIASARHRVADYTSYLVVTLSGARSRREIRNAGGGDVGACRILLRRLGPIARTVVGAGVEVDHWLAPRELAQTIRVAYAPLARRELLAHDLRASRPAWKGVEAGVPPSFAGPSWAECAWGAYHHDGCVSAMGEIEWPRTPKDQMMLQAILGASAKARRVVAVHYEPISPLAAEHTLLVDKTRRDVAIRLRQRTGQLPPERERKELAVAAAQDTELAHGHGLLRFCGYAGVTVSDPALLEEAWDELAADAGASGLRLRRCSGWLDAAFAAAAVPVGLGLPGRR